MNEGVPVHGSGSDFAMVVANMGLFGRREIQNSMLCFPNPLFFFPANEDPGFNAIFILWGLLKPYLFINLSIKTEKIINTERGCVSWSFHGL